MCPVRQISIRFSPCLSRNGLIGIFEQKERGGGTYSQPLVHPSTVDKWTKPLIASQLYLQYLEMA